MIYDFRVCSVFILCFYISCIYAVPPQNNSETPNFNLHWEQWKTEVGKTYKVEEENLRFSAWIYNWHQVRKVPEFFVNH